MSKLMIAFSCSVIVAAVVAADGKSAAANDAAKQPSTLQKVGGFIYDTRKIEGKFIFVNAQSKADVAAHLDKAMEMVKQNCGWFVKCETAKPFKPNAAASVLREFGATAGVVLVDDQSLPAIAAFPEEHCCFVNVAALTADKPSKEKLALRLNKELGRAFVFALGGGYTTYESGAMVPISGLAGLDALKTDFIAPDSAMAALRAGQQIGFKAIRRTTYLRACKEGWAPAPTNEFQKAVWEQVKDPKKRFEKDFSDKK